MTLIHIEDTVSHLNQEPQVDILALWLLPVHLTVLVVSDVDSLGEKVKMVTHTDLPAQR